MFPGFDSADPQWHQKVMEDIVVSLYNQKKKKRLLDILIDIKKNKNFYSVMQHSPQFKKSIEKAIDFGAKLKTTYDSNKKMKSMQSVKYNCEQNISPPKKGPGSPESPYKHIGSYSPSQLANSSSKLMFMPQTRSQASFMMAASREKDFRKSVRTPAERSLAHINQVASGYGTEFFKLVNKAVSRNKEDLMPESESLREKKKMAKKSMFVKGFRNKFKGSQNKLKKLGSGDSYPEDSVDENTIDLITKPKPILRRQVSFLRRSSVASVQKKSALKQPDSVDETLNFKVRRVASIDPNLRVQESWLSMIRNQVRGQVSKEILSAAKQCTSSGSIALDIQCSKDLFTPRTYSLLINQYREAAELEEKARQPIVYQQKLNEDTISRVRGYNNYKDPPSFKQLADYHDIKTHQKSYSYFYKQLMEESIRSLVNDEKIAKISKTSSDLRKTQYTDLIPKNIDHTRYCPKEILEEREASNNKACMSLSVFKRMRLIAASGYDGSNHYNRSLKDSRSKISEHAK